MKHFSEKIISGLLRTKEKLDAGDVKNGLHWLNVHGVTVQSMSALQGGGPFLAAFAIALGASNYEIGLIATIASVGEFMHFPGYFCLRP